ncbi:sugar transferase, partial [Verrucomicrobia bacterium]|nr:sugar transferase [Verrucomicrobiota bacterium]
YVANMSIRLDVKILLLTVKKVILKNDISSDSEVTMSAFTGSKND